ncbi:uncharacterized protein Tco025E_07715 [Trypanosoma conorhini]|uniref:Uncharacterized protein n=1 Tax=Trypanosoma conorhini TaxID=83891 RepID=A0A3R7MNT5_9TRYP|nr:uncharacterized protein Tco025E_07715 [Trypanosoma conorhini]RNF05859.1 hypothetical protein Tco025E_07715 [Trypanosoma conorhini]
MRLCIPSLLLLFFFLFLFAALPPRKTRSEAGRISGRGRHLFFPFSLFFRFGFSGRLQVARRLLAAATYAARSRGQQAQEALPRRRLAAKRSRRRRDRGPSSRHQTLNNPAATPPQPTSRRTLSFFSLLEVLARRCRPKGTRRVRARGLCGRAPKARERARYGWWRLWRTRPSSRPAARDRGKRPAAKGRRAFSTFRGELALDLPTPCAGRGRSARRAVLRAAPACEDGSGERGEP